jgi:SAM-dependent methyltransferase
MISARLVDVVRCPECASPLALADGPTLACPSCGRRFDGSGGYADLRPARAFEEQTKYLDEALHADARHESVAPPLLGSSIRNRMLRRFLQLAPGDRTLDLGCGSGRALLWNTDTGAALTGLDISPFFAREALASCDLVLGDLRKLPVRDGAFAKAWSLDVLEHLSPDALKDMLHEAHRILGSDGRLFVYTHVRKNGWLAGGVRLVNRLASVFERVGLVDLKQERLRKSDHLNPIADYDDLARVLDECGFTLERITYYTPIVGAFVENILVRVAERVMTRQAKRDDGAGGTPDDVARAVRAAAKDRIRQRGVVYAGLRTLSAFMMLDVWLFGRVRSGPFFALLRKRPLAHAADSAV